MVFKAVVLLLGVWWLCIVPLIYSSDDSFFVSISVAHLARVSLECAENEVPRPTLVLLVSCLNY
jgi:hypothetical protein